MLVWEVSYIFGNCHMIWVQNGCDVGSHLKKVAIMIPISHGKWPRLTEKPLISHQEGHMALQHHDSSWPCSPGGIRLQLPSPLQPWKYLAREMAECHTVNLICFKGSWTGNFPFKRQYLNLVTHLPSLLVAVGLTIVRVLKYGYRCHFDGSFFNHFLHIHNCRLYHACSDTGVLVCTYCSLYLLYDILGRLVGRERSMIIYTKSTHYSLQPFKMQNSTSILIFSTVNSWTAMSSVLLLLLSLIHSLTFFKGGVFTNAIHLNSWCDPGVDHQWAIENKEMRILVKLKQAWGPQGSLPVLAAGLPSFSR